MTQNPFANALHSINQNQGNPSGYDYTGGAFNSSGGDVGQQYYNQPPAGLPTGNTTQQQFAPTVQGGSPTLGGGSGEAFNYLNDIGAGFDPAPFLTAQFNRVADLTRTRLDSEFSGSGRNLGASMPARSEQLQTLAGQIFDPSRIFEFDPTNVLINRLGGLIPNAGGTSSSQQPVFNNGLFGFI